MNGDMTIAELGPRPLFWPISGTYKNKWPANDRVVLELRVDVDGRRPQQRISGDVFRQLLWLSPRRFGEIAAANIIYDYSFVVENVTRQDEGSVAVLTGPITYYQDPTRANETIEVRIPMVLAGVTGNYLRSWGSGSKSPDAVVNLYRAGVLMRTYVCPKISNYFRRVYLEIDCVGFPNFPEEIDPDIAPSPTNLALHKVSVRSCFQRAGIDMTVHKDDVLTELEMDPGYNWDYGELHDLMEDHFERFSYTLQWNLYGVVVPRFAWNGTDTYRPGLFGIMFDWGGGQPGDTHFRQGAAVAYQPLESYSLPVPGYNVNDLYGTDEQKARLFLWTFIHELGHAFNLPHTWDRTQFPNPASRSFMNYPENYTGGPGTNGEEHSHDYWSDFEWEFDNVELIWMRHQDRIDVIFGGTDWVWNNLSVFMDPEVETQSRNLSLELSAPPVLDFAEPVRLEVKVTNNSDVQQVVVDRLDPEDHLLTLFIRRPNGDCVRYIPPVHCENWPGDLVELAPGESIRASVLVSFGARGLQFQEPGEYRIRAYYGLSEDAAIVSKTLRMRVATPTSRQDEELAYLLFDRKAAKFLYFNGTERYPEVTSKLEEAVRRYRKTNPRVVRHIRAALGTHASRHFKSIETKRGKRVVVVRKPQLRDAISHLREAVAALPDTRQTAVDDTRYANLAYRLAECQIGAGKKEEARKTLDVSMEYLKKRKVGKRLIDYLETRRKALLKAKTKAKGKKRKA
ncbi:MAG: tetratricopeptide repeat protein [Phycisphaerales bacterium]|nr:MAG: tetratricopeptide repeat protein [Phycisphaerales bacterium]